MMSFGALPENKFRWSILPPVPLRGVGTALVESVEHYTARLSWITGARASQMFSLPAPYEESGTCKLGSSTTFCGPGPKFKQRIKNLEALTGVDTVRCGSFLVLDEILTKFAVGRNTALHRWCPQCFQAWDHEYSWEPLIWTVDLQKTCPTHGCDLESTCPQCGAVQWLYAKYDCRRTCRHCQASLAGPGHTSDRPAYYRWAEYQIAEVIKLCATPGQVPIRLTAYETFIKGLVQPPHDVSLIPTTIKAAVTRIKLQQPTGRVSLRTLINLCALQGVSIVEILLDPLAASSSPLIDLWGDYQTLEFPSERHEFKIKAYRECLTDVMEHCIRLYIPSTDFLLRKIKLNRDLARELSVDIYEAYEEAHRSQGSQNDLINAERAFKLAMRIFTAPGFNAFGTFYSFYIPNEAWDISISANIDRKKALAITISALYCAQALERMKTKMVKQSM